VLTDKRGLVERVLQAVWNACSRQRIVEDVAVLADETRGAHASGGTQQTGRHASVGGVHVETSGAFASVYNIHSFCGAHILHPNHNL
jgi:hypothetical protein